MMHCFRCQGPIENQSDAEVMHADCSRQKFDDAYTLGMLEGLRIANGTIEEQIETVRKARMFAADQERGGVKPSE